MSGWLVAALVVFGGLAIVAVHDVTQRRHAILRNFPIIGHLRFMLERVGPELRQYIVTSNNEELPFSRDERSWVYASAKKENSYFGFGTDNDISQPGYVLINHSTFPYPGADGEHLALPGSKVIGRWRERPGAFRPTSLVNVSAMSFGALSGAAISAINQGAQLGGFLHNTGEGGLSLHHRRGGELVMQLGTGYFGARAPDGSFDLDRLLQSIDGAPVRAIEIKLSQGAKPGVGGVLPGRKVTAEIAAARGVPEGQTVASPSRHRAFGNVEELIDFVERIAGATGLPVGIKAAVGQMRFWDDLTAAMAARRQGPDFVTVDGAEGGTGAGPLVFTDHVAVPFRTGMARVYSAFARHDLQRDVTFIGSGKLGYPQQVLVAMALGADMVNVAREAMMAIGCIQAQRCHTDHCPTGVATQNRWLVRGLDPELKSVRVANYIHALRHDVLKVTWACGQAHPALLDFDIIELTTDANRLVPLRAEYGLGQIPRLHDADRVELETLMDQPR
jgi:glutamate synthase domain-containing protein 2